MRYRLMATYRGVPLRGGHRPVRQRGGAVRGLPAAGGTRLRAGHRALAQAGDPGPGRTGAVGVPAGGHVPRRAAASCSTISATGCISPTSAHDAYQASSLGYWQVDRGVFELVTPRDEVTELTEERVEKPLRWGELAEATGPMATYPYGTAPWPVAEPPAPASPPRLTPLPPRKPCPGPVARSTMSNG